MKARWLIPGFRWLRTIFASVGFLFLFISLTPVTSWWARALAGRWSKSRCEVLVVPGGSELGDGILGYSSYWRAVYAVQAFRWWHFQLVLLSGGGPPHARVAESMRDFLVASGVPPETIRVEIRSTSTRQNAVNCARMLAGRKGCVTLLTSDFHMFRAYRSFRKAGLDVRPTPIPDAAKSADRWYTRWDACLVLYRETAKILYYRARGWI